MTGPVGLLIRIVELFTVPEPANSQQVFHAWISSGTVVRRLQLAHKHISTRYPKHTDALAVIDGVLAILRREHGGILPDKYFYVWYICLRRRESAFNSPMGRGARNGILSRWHHSVQMRELTEVGPMQSGDCIPRLTQSLREWVQKFYTRSPYDARAP